MMKTLAVAAALAALASPALAQSSGVPVNAQINAMCSAPSSGSVMNLGNIVGPDGRLVNLLAMRTNSAVISGVWCNAPGTEISASGTLLQNQDFAGAVPAGFTREIAVEPRVETRDGTFVTDEGSGPHTLGLFAGDLVVRINAWDEVHRPVAGAYTGTITVTLNPGA